MPQLHNVNPLLTAHEGFPVRNLKLVATHFRPGKGLSAAYCDGFNPSAICRFYTGHKIYGFDASQCFQLL
jgi:hypothetical protein